MLRVGNFGRRTVLLMLVTCVLCFYLGRLSNTPNYYSCSPDMLHNQQQQGQQQQQQSQSQKKSESMFFSDDQEELDAAVKRFMGQDGKTINREKKLTTTTLTTTRSPSRATTTTPSSPSSDSSSQSGSDKNEIPPTTPTTTTALSECTTPPPPAWPKKCFKSSHVKDNERVGQRGPYPFFAFKDCKTEKVGAGPAQWTICPIKLGPDSKIYSFGITRPGGQPDASFERDMLDAYDASALIFDPFPAARDLTQRLIDSAEGVFKEQVFEKKFRYWQLGLWNQDGSRHFNSKDGTYAQQPNTGDLILPVVTLSTVLCMTAPDWIDILKIDIPNLPTEILKELEKVEEWPMDQILVRFAGKQDPWERDQLLRIFKKKGFIPLDPNRANADEKVTFVRYTYIHGEFIERP